MKLENQSRHEKLIDFLSQFSQFQLKDGKSALKKVEESRTSDKVEEISTEDINNAVVVFTDFLNIYSGSANNINLYRLLQAYLMIPEYRGKINEIVEEAHSYAFHNKK